MHKQIPDVKFNNQYCIESLVAIKMSINETISVREQYSKTFNCVQTNELLLVLK